MNTHPATAIVPELTGVAYAALKEDIRAHGQIVPISLWQGMIVDGRARLRACRELGLRARTAELTELPSSSAVSYVLSANLHRRHLTPSQLAMVAARARSFFDKEASSRRAGKAQPDGIRGDSRDLAGRAVGVSGRSVDDATIVLRDGVDEVVAACDAGTLAVSKARRLVTLPAHEQRAALQTPKRRDSSRQERKARAPFAQFDLLVTQAQALKKLAGDFSPLLSSLIADGHFDATTLRTGVEQIRAAATALTDWAGAAESDLAATPVASVPDAGARYHDTAGSIH